MAHQIIDPTLYPLSFNSTIMFRVNIQRLSPRLRMWYHPQTPLTNPQKRTTPPSRERRCRSSSLQRSERSSVIPRLSLPSELLNILRHRLNSSAILNCRSAPLLPTLSHQFFCCRFRGQNPSRNPKLRVMSMNVNQTKFHTGPDVDVAVRFDSSGRDSG